MNKEVPDKAKALNDDIALDFYVGGREFIDGIGDPAKQKVKNLLEEFSSNLRETSLPYPEAYRLQEKNYGYGADWVVMLVEFIANNDWIGATAKIGGLITLGKHVGDFIKKKGDQNVYLGIRAGRLVAISAISKEIEVKNIELLTEYEIDRGEAGFTDKEYLFVLGINKREPTPQDVYNKDNIYRGILFVVLVSWRGGVKSVHKI